MPGETDPKEAQAPSGLAVFAFIVMPAVGLIIGCVAVRFHEAAGARQGC